MLNLSLFIGMVKAKILGENWHEMCSQVNSERESGNTKKILKTRRGRVFINMDGHISRLFSPVYILDHAGHMIYQI